MKDLIKNHHNLRLEVRNMRKILFVEDNRFHMQDVLSSGKPIEIAGKSFKGFQDLPDTTNCIVFSDSKTSITIAVYFKEDLSDFKTRFLQPSFIYWFYEKRDFDEPFKEITEFEYFELNKIIAKILARKESWFPENFHAFQPSIHGEKFRRLLFDFIEYYLQLHNSRINAGLDQYF